MLSANLSNCPIMPQVTRNQHNELALVDEHGNTVGLLVSNDPHHLQHHHLHHHHQQPPPRFQLPRKEMGLHLKYPVPCSKLATVTIEWLKEHFHENQHNSLPRSVMFEEYSGFCYGIEMKPFNQAVFGKIVRACFPNLATRRLGVRGQSRYHYAGLGTKPSSPYAQRFKSIQEKRNVVRAVNNLRRKKCTRKPAQVARTAPSSASASSSSSGNVATAASRYDLHHKLSRSQLKNDNAPVFLDSLSLATPPYPTCNDVDCVRYNWPPHLVEHFLNFYVAFNQHLLTLIVAMDFHNTILHLRSFFTRYPPSCRSLIHSSPEICRLVALCDDVMFQKATASLLPDCLASLTTEFNVSIRKYAKELPLWIGEAAGGDDDFGIAPSLLDARINSARTWCDYVIRVTTLCHITIEARKTLADSGVVFQLLHNLNNLSMNDVTEQCSYAGCYDFTSDARMIVQGTTKDRERTRQLVHEFSKLLERMASVERFAALLERIIEEDGGMLPEPQHNSPDHSFDVITPHTRLFMMKWSMYGSKMLTEVTLHLHHFFGTFHLVMLLFGDYINHVICLRQERATRLKRKRDVIKKDSPYLHCERRTVQVASTSASTSGLPQQHQNNNMSAFTPVMAPSGVHFRPHFHQPQPSAGAFFGAYPQVPPPHFYPHQVAPYPHHHPQQQQRFVAPGTVSQPSPDSDFYLLHNSALHRPATVGAAEHQPPHQEYKKL